MADYITMTCKSCGGKLQITPEIEDFACMYCGTEFKVNRGGGIVALSPVVEELQKVSVSTDKTASELAIIRLKEEVSTLRQDLDEREENLNGWITQKNKEKEIAENEAIQKNRRIFFIIFLAITLLSASFLSGTYGVVIPLAISGLLTLLIYFILRAVNPFDMFLFEVNTLYEKGGFNIEVQQIAQRIPQKVS